MGFILFLAFCVAGIMVALFIIGGEIRLALRSPEEKAEAKRKTDARTGAYWLELHRSGQFEWPDKETIEVNKQAYIDWGVYDEAIRMAELLE